MVAAPAVHFQVVKRVPEARPINALNMAVANDVPIV
jgi:hypothetical protein